MFLLTVGLGVTLLIVSMEVNIRRARGADSNEKADLEQSEPLEVEIVGEQGRDGTVHKGTQTPDEDDRLRVLANPAILHVVTGSQSDLLRIAHQSANANQQLPAPAVRQTVLLGV
jgi:hypothetical protein